MSKKHPQTSNKTALRDSPFNPERYAFSPTARQWIDSVLRAVESYEAERKLRQRRRKVTDQKVFERQVEALICDVVFTFIFKPKGTTGKISVSLSKQKVGPKQNGHPLVNSTLSKTLALLGHEGVGLIQVNKGSKQTGRQTTVYPAPSLEMQVNELRLTTHDFKLRKEQPLVQLRAPKVDGRKGRLLPLNEQDPDVLRMTKELEEINTFLSESQIEYHGDNTHIDERDRRIYRVFNGSLRFNGQPYGGFWKYLSGEDRLSSLYIDDEPIQELDLKSASLQIAYALKGIKPLDDFYAIPGLQRLEREQLKKIVLTFMNGGREAFKRPISNKIYKKLCQDIDESKEMVLRRILSAIKEFYKPVAEFFNPQGFGYLSFIQGELIMQTVSSLMAQKIVALPTGDAIHVKQSAEGQALEAFQKSFEEKTGSKEKVVLSA